MADNFVRGQHPSYRIHASRNGYGVDLTYQALTEGLRFGNGRVTFGKREKKYYTISVPIPRAKVNGTLTIKGKSIPVSGWGYSDISSQNFSGNKQAVLWRSLRFFHKDYQINFLEFVTPTEYGSEPVSWLIVTDNERVLYAARDCQVKASDYLYDDRFDYDVPQKISLMHKEGTSSIQGTWTVQKNLESFDILHHFSPVLKGIIKTFVARPVIFRHKSKVDFQLDIPQVQAHLSGEGISEVLRVK